MPQLTILLTIAIAFLFAVLISPILIPFLKRLKFGQSIREEGPESHKAKSGTPTMGGVMIIFAIIFTTVFAVWNYEHAQFSEEFFILIFVLVGYGLIGFLDDLIKIIKKRNLGLTSKQKMLGQIVIAIIVYIILHNNGLDRKSTRLNSSHV